MATSVEPRSRTLPILTAAEVAGLNPSLADPIECLGPRLIHGVEVA